MTEAQYKELQAWCSSNLNRKIYPELYKKKVALRNTATQIRRNIILCRGYIKDSTFILGNCKTQEAVAKWKGIVLIHQASKKVWQDNFKNLQDETNESKD
jgi:hypothetical protein